LLAPPIETTTTTPVLEPPRKRPTIDPRARHDDGRGSPSPTWSPCDGPVPCGGFRLGLSLGGAFPTGARFAVDSGWDLTPAVTAVVVGEAFTATRLGVAGGAAWRTSIDRTFELSLRGLVGGGIGTRSISDKPLLEPEECVADENGQLPSAIPTWFVSPTIAVRGRIGYVFVEVGTYWHLNIDALPAGYFAIGVAPFGIL
jgi:hypothetical protein